MTAARDVRAGLRAAQRATLGENPVEQAAEDEPFERVVREPAAALDALADRTHVVHDAEDPVEHADAISLVPGDFRASRGSPLSAAALAATTARDPWSAPPDIARPAPSTRRSIGFGFAAGKRGARRTARGRIGSLPRPSSASDPGPARPRARAPWRVPCSVKVARPPVPAWSWAAPRRPAVRLWEAPWTARPSFRRIPSSSLVRRSPAAPAVAVRSRQEQPTSPAPRPSPGPVSPSMGLPQALTPKTRPVSAKRRLPARSGLMSRAKETFPPAWAAPPRRRFACLRRLASGSRNTRQRRER